MRKVLALLLAGCASPPAALTDRAEAMILEQIRIAEIPAPTGAEGARAAYVAEEFRRAGLTGVALDAAGNVLGWKRGQGKRVLAITAHLDTVHPDPVIRIERNGPVLKGPGACDDAAGLVAILEIARRWDRPHEADVLFAATVGEEGRGDLKGARHLVRTQKIDLFVSIDGVDPGRVVNGGIGSRRWKIGFVSEGGGGHSWSDFGRANPAHALGRMIARLARFDAPRDPKTTFNVGVVSAADADDKVLGTSVNTVPPGAMAQVDLRSAGREELARAEAALLAAAEEALAEENAWSRARGKDVPVRLVRELVGDRPFGRTAEDHELVRVVREELDRAGFRVTLGWASTDANAAMAAGLPAVTLSAGGRGTGVHGRDETHDTTGRVQELDALREALFRLAR
jgi:acetylornithine deacetylase/succinyl-diaminopimelate desuccinylase-like protein